MILYTTDSKVIALRNQDPTSPKNKLISTIISREVLCLFYFVFYMFNIKSTLLSDLTIAQLIITFFFSMLPTIIFFQDRISANDNTYTDQFEILVGQDVDEMNSDIRSSAAITLKQNYVSNELDPVDFVDDYLRLQIDAQCQIEILVFMNGVQKLLNKYWMVPGSYLSDLSNTISNINNHSLNLNATWLSLQNNVKKFSQQLLIGKYEINVLNDQITSLSPIAQISNVEFLAPSLPIPTVSHYCTSSSLKECLTQIQQNIVNTYQQLILGSNTQNNFDYASVGVYAGELSQEIEKLKCLFLERVFFNFDSLVSDAKNFASQCNGSSGFDDLMDMIDQSLVANKSLEINNEINNLLTQSSSISVSNTNTQYPALSLITDESGLQSDLRSIYNNLFTTQQCLNLESSLDTSFTNLQNTISANGSSISSIYNSLQSMNFASYNLNQNGILRQLTRNMYTNPNYNGILFFTQNTINNVYDGLNTTVDSTSEIYLKTSDSFPTSTAAMCYLYGSNFANTVLFSPILIQNDIVDENFKSLTQNPSSLTTQGSFNISNYSNGFLIENDINVGYPTSFCIRAVTGNPKLFFYTKKNGVISNIYFFNPDLIFSAPSTIYTHKDFYNYNQIKNGSSSAILKTSFQINPSDLVDVQTVQWPIQQIHFYCFPYSNATRTLIIDNQISCSTMLDAYNLVFVMYFSDMVTALSVVVNKSSCQYNFWTLTNNNWVAKLT